MEQPTERRNIYRFVVGDKEYESPKQVITGEELRQIAGISPKLRIFVRDHSSARPKRSEFRALYFVRQSDREITHTETIDLAQPHEIKFYTLNAPTLDIC